MKVVDKHRFLDTSVGFNPLLRSCATFGLELIHAQRSCLSPQHLWLSIFVRPRKSYFTRVQRLTCALTLLFLMMITNAMWFQDPGADPTADPAARPSTGDDTAEPSEPVVDPDEADTTEDGVSGVA